MATKLVGLPELNTGSDLDQIKLNRIAISVPEGAFVVECSDKEIQVQVELLNRVLPCVYRRNDYFKLKRVKITALVRLKTLRDLCFRVSLEERKCK